jgi:hypothetical protein
MKKEKKKSRCCARSMEEDGKTEMEISIHRSTFSSERSNVLGDGSFEKALWESDQSRGTEVLGSSRRLHMTNLVL